jgi:predicted mannosyl-3-phosphoglycerate phosphatase (HAD superfamily)
MATIANASGVSLLVLTCVDGALRDGATSSCATSRAAVQALSQRGIPVVLVSHHDGEALRTIQEELMLREPFIAGNGAALHVPAGYFEGNTTGNGADEWQVIGFDHPSIDRALAVLIEMYTRGQQQMLLIGIGVDRDHCALLRRVDVPIVVRQPHLDDSDLRMLLPGAYLTTATGASGWAEALLGSL